MGVTSFSYSGHLNLNTKMVEHSNGAVVPVDEAAVTAARADHFAAGGGQAGPAAVANAAPVVAPVVAPFSYSGPLNLNTKMVEHNNGAVVPVDEAAVATARADHFASGGGQAGHIAVAHAAPVVAPFIYSGPLNLNTKMVEHNNDAVVPVDEAAVATACADHFAAGGGQAGPATVAHATPFSYSGPLNLNTKMVEHTNGAVVPVDEAAVATARADHFAAGGGQAGAAVVAHAAP